MMVLYVDWASAWQILEMQTEFDPDFLRRNWSSRPQWGKMKLQTHGIVQILGTNTGEICQKEENGMEKWNNTKGEEQNPANKTVHNICLITIAADLSHPECVELPLPLPYYGGNCLLFCF